MTLNLPNLRKVYSSTALYSSDNFANINVQRISAVLGCMVLFIYS